MTDTPVGNAYLTAAQLTSNPVLEDYLESVRAWHGYIRFLGLPDRRDKRDVLIERLFVEPLVTRRYVSPDDSPYRWREDAQSVFECLSDEPRLVLLGDREAASQRCLAI